MKTEAQKKAKRNYMKKVKILRVEMYPTECDIIEEIDRHENKSGYIKRLIRNDIERGRG